MINVLRDGTMLWVLLNAAAGAAFGSLRLRGDHMGIDSGYGVPDLAGILVGLAQSVPLLRSSRATGRTIVWWMAVTTTSLFLIPLADIILQFITMTKASPPYSVPYVVLWLRPVLAGTIGIVTGAIQSRLLGLSTKQRIVWLCVSAVSFPMLFLLPTDFARAMRSYVLDEFELRMLGLPGGLVAGLIYGILSAPVVGRALAKPVDRD